MEKEHMIQVIENCIGKGCFDRTFFNVEAFDKICIWGTKLRGLGIYYLLKKNCHTPLCFCDNNSKLYNTEIVGGVKCISIAELCEVKENTLVVIASDYKKEIAHQLEEMGIEYYCEYQVMEYMILLDKACVWNINAYGVKNVIEKLGLVYDMLEDEKSLQVLYEWSKVYFEYKSVFLREYVKGVKYEKLSNPFRNIYEDDQYFCSQLVNFDETSVIVDCGAYIGDTLAETIFRGIPFKKYIAFELNQINYSELMKKVNKTTPENNKKIEIHNLGVYSEGKDILYGDTEVANGAGSTVLYNTGGTVGKVIAIDEFLNERITHIKMDIEGTELEALKGAQNTIITQKPTLMICLYHKVDDFWEIPLYLKQLVPEYKFYLRHHSLELAETVLYAIPSCDK